VAAVIVEKVMYSAQRCSNVYWSICPRFEGFGSSLARKARPRHACMSPTSVSFTLLLILLSLLLTCIHTASSHPCPTWQPKVQPSSASVHSHPSLPFPTPATNHPGSQRSRRDNHKPHSGPLRRSPRREPLRMALHNPRRS
jgi:hypothetical protein